MSIETGQTWREALKQYTVLADITFYSKNSPYVDVTLKNTRMPAHWMGPKEVMNPANRLREVIVKMIVEQTSVVSGEGGKFVKPDGTYFRGKVIDISVYGPIVDIGFPIVIQELSSPDAELDPGDWIEAVWGSPVFIYDLHGREELKDYDEWERFLKKETCPMCLHPRDDFLIAELSASKLYLSPNQRWIGYVYTVYHDHKTDLHQISERENQKFYEDTMQALRAVSKTFYPDKMNIDNLGNKIPHLHWHIIPRYAGDDNWRNPTWADWYEGKHTNLSREQYNTIIKAIGKNL